MPVPAPPGVVRDVLTMVNPPFLAGRMSFEASELGEGLVTSTRFLHGRLQ